MGCLGLQKFFLHILPVVDWSVESNRSVLNVLLRRLDKTIGKIAKKPSIRRRANWAAISNWITGLYNTLTFYPYIAHLHPLKVRIIILLLFIGFFQTITQMSLRLTIGDHCTEETIALSTNANNSASVHLTHHAANTILNASVTPPIFNQAVLKLAAFLMQALGQVKNNLILHDFICIFLVRFFIGTYL